MFDHCQLDCSGSTPKFFPMFLLVGLVDFGPGNRKMILHRALTFLFKSPESGHVFVFVLLFHRVTFFSVQNFFKNATKNEKRDLHVFEEVSE